jgi:hypothetical protein
MQVQNLINTTIYVNVMLVIIMLLQRGIDPTTLLKSKRNQVSVKILVPTRCMYTIPKPMQ